jgi:uncharacterized membrane protein HdeD (DUF308 family)
VAQRVGGRDPQDALGSLARHWGWVFFFGAVMVIAGIIAVAWPGRTLVVVAVVFGVQLIFDGIYRLVAAVAAPLESGGMRVLLAFLGILSVIVGLWAVRHVLITILSLTLFLGVYWVVHGLVVTFEAISNHDMPARGANIVAGIFGIIAGLIIFLSPGTSLPALALVLGFWLIVYGAFQIFIALQLRKGATVGGPGAVRPAVG